MCRSTNLDIVIEYLSWFISWISIRSYFIYYNNNTQRFAQQYIETINIINRNLFEYILLFVDTVFGFNIRSVCINVVFALEYQTSTHFSFFYSMDICRWNVISANESISFRWIIIVMIYTATIILCLSSDSFDERFHVIASNINTNDSTTGIKEMVK